jgi:hypothetical protein
VLFSTVPDLLEEFKRILPESAPHVKAPDGADSAAEHRFATLKKIQYSLKAISPDDTDTT